VDSTFKSHVEELHPKLKQLRAMAPVTVSTLPADAPKRAVYLFSEGAKHLYAGRTNRLRARLREHAALSSDHNSASFAFLLARHETSMTKLSRKKCMTDNHFRAAFDRAKERLRKANVRYVEERDPTRQALLEIYIAVAQKAQHNSFENH
jgi:predicted GIY-YIG superfamily endonuclease